MEYPQHLNMSKINKAFRKQDRIKDLQKYECIIQDFEEFKLLANEDFTIFTYAKDGKIAVLDSKFAGSFNAREE